MSTSNVDATPDLPTTDSEGRIALVRFLDERRLTRTAFAEVAGIQQSDLSRYLADEPERRTRPQLRNAMRIEEATRRLGGPRAVVKAGLWLQAPSALAEA